MRVRGDKSQYYLPLSANASAGVSHGWRIVETRGGAFPLVAVQFKEK